MTCEIKNWTQTCSVLTIPVIPKDIDQTFCFQNDSHDKICFHLLIFVYALCFVYVHISRFCIALTLVAKMISILYLFPQELSVIVARGRDNTMLCYPVVETIHR